MGYKRKKYNNNVADVLLYTNCCNDVLGTKDRDDNERDRGCDCEKEDSKPRRDCKWLYLL